MSNKNNTKSQKNFKEKGIKRSSQLTELLLKTMKKKKKRKRQLGLTQNGLPVAETLQNSYSGKLKTWSRAKNLRAIFSKKTKMVWQR